MGKKRGRYHRAKKARAREVVKLVRNGDGIYVADYANDGPTLERDAHQGGIQVVDRTVTTGGIVLGKGSFALGESVIGWLFRRGQLAVLDGKGKPDETATQRLHGAANWFLTTWRDAGLASRVTSSYQPATSKGKGEMSVKASRAMAALTELWKPERLGPRRAALLEQVICFNAPPRPDEIPILRGALEMLARLARI